MRGLDVRHGKIQDRAGVIELGLLWTVEHQAHAATIEECQSRRRFEQQLQPQHLLVEVGGAFHIVGGYLDLPESRDSDGFFCGDGHVLTSLLELVSIANYIGGGKSRAWRKKLQSRIRNSPTCSRWPTACTP